MQLITIYTIEVMLSCSENFWESNVNNFNLATVNGGIGSDRSSMFYGGL